MTVVWLAAAALVAFLLLGILRYRNWKMIVTGPSGHSYTVFRASRQPGMDNRFNIVYGADGLSAAGRDTAERDLLAWGAPFATTHRCTEIEICAATNIRTGRLVRRYSAHCTPFRRRADGVWSKVT